ncbi:MULTISPECIES: phosphoglucosamine mutase [Rhodomicrobium]|uniref:phosphoglucosamine mutase n=1 Tax=Rhodomicrobium TaxID=1068 RepID=UPI000B4B5194|nr:MULTISPECIES: phosphoglucosamine mutase [Rhodomicrobium]
MSGRLFGTDGIRGQANSSPMTAEIAMKVGMAAAHLFTNGDHRHRVVIGKDTRLSGYVIESALVSGFTSAGMDVFQLGPMPTPAVAMLTRSLRADLGVMISASHNPYQDNGIKIFDREGFKLSDDFEARIEELVGGDVSGLLAEPDKMGRAKRIDGVFDRYIEYAKRTLDRSIRLDGLKVVIDCAHGAAYRVAPQSLWELGADVVAMGVTPDGFNINRDCGSTSPDALCRKVRQVGAHIGVALDGDADRVIIVDETGAIVDGDQLLAVIAQSWLADKRLVGNGVVATVMSNLGLERFLNGMNLDLLRTPVGDRAVVERMRAGGYNLGGEQSGHIVMTDYTTTGDGLVTALQILGVVITSGKPVSEVCKRFEPVPQVLKSVRTNGSRPLENPSVSAIIEKNRLRLGNNGRLLIRPSGTEPVVRVMAEGDDEALVASVVGDIVTALETASAHP